MMYSSVKVPKALVIVALLPVISCVPEQNGVRDRQQENAALSVGLECKPIRDDQAAPLFGVYARIGEYLMKVAEVKACETIGRDQYARYRIPEDALAAAGGRWEGSGDCLYLARDGEKVLVFHSAFAEPSGSDPSPYRLVAAYEDGRFRFEGN